MCFYVLSYIKAIKKPKWILLSASSFLLALLVCPSRAYLIVPVPFFVELAFLIKLFKPLTFIKKTLIFYFPLLIFQALLFLNGDRLHPAFMPQLDILSRLQQVAYGNLYTLSLPFQAVSTLFIDLSFVREILGKGELLFPFINKDLNGFIVINIILLILSFGLGAVIKSKKFISFTFRIMSLTILLEAIFYIFGRLSLHDGQIIYISVIKWLGSYSQDLNPSIFQASFGSFYFILGLLLCWEWWKHQRSNKILKVVSFAWIWSISSEVILYLTSHWMPNSSIDRYIITISFGAVIFTAGIFTLCLQAIPRIKKFGLKLSASLLIGIFIILIGWKNYQLLDHFFYTWNENLGNSANWQDTMYRKFLSKFGEDNLAKSIILYIDFEQNPVEVGFNQGSFVGPARFRLFYNRNGKLIRDNCKSVTSDIDALKESLVIQNGEEGFLIDSICINSVLSYQKEFYPLSNFYAYRMEDKEFINIREKVLDRITSSTKPVISSSAINRTDNKIPFKREGINPDSFYYPVKRIWEKFHLFILFVVPQSKINYERTLFDERLSELNYVAENRLLSKVESSSKRLAFQAGTFTSLLIKQNKAQDKNDLIRKFGEDMKLLARLRDLFPSNSSYWLFIQQDIDTFNILSSRLK